MFRIYVCTIMRLFQLCSYSTLLNRTLEILEFLFKLHFLQFGFLNLSNYMHKLFNETNMHTLNNTQNKFFNSLASIYFLIKLKGKKWSNQTESEHPRGSTVADKSAE